MKQNAPHLEKGGTLGKMRHNQKNAPQLQKCATLGKEWHTCKNAAQLAAHLEKCSTMRQTWKRAAHRKMRHNQSAPQSRKRHHNPKNVPHFTKCGTLGRERQV